MLSSAGLLFLLCINFGRVEGGFVDEDKVEIDLILRLLRSQATRSYVSDSPAMPLDPNDIVGAVQEVARHEAYMHEYMEVALRKATTVVIGGITEETSRKRSRPATTKKPDPIDVSEDDEQALEKIAQLLKEIEAAGLGEQSPPSKDSKSKSRASKIANVDKVRKKDSPTEIAGILEQIQVQETQKQWVNERHR